MPAHLGKSRSKSKEQRAKSKGAAESFRGTLIVQSANREPQESVGFGACQTIFDAEDCESHLRCLMQGGKNGA